MNIKINEKFISRQHLINHLATLAHKKTDAPLTMCVTTTTKTSYAPAQKTKADMSTQKVNHHRITEIMMSLNKSWCQGF